MDIEVVKSEKFKENFAKKWRLNNDGCNIWTAVRDKDDYGQVAVGTGSGRIQRAHRVAYVMATGEDIPEGMDIDHTCHMRRCCNFEHLELVTHAENMKNLRKKNDWADSDEEFEERGRNKTSTEEVMEEALAIIRRSAVDEKGGGYSMITLEDAPWRQLAIKEGFIDTSKFSRVKLFLDVVRLGVDWKIAARDILQVSVLTVYDWSLNKDWQEEFIAAKKEGRKSRYSGLEERHIDEMERKIDFADFKDVADSLKKLREQDEERIAIKKGQENSGQPNVTIVFGANPEKALRALVELGDTIEAEYKELPDANGRV